MSDEPSQLAGVDEEKAIDEARSEPLNQADKEAQAAVTDFSGKVNGRESMKVRVHSPFQNYYDGQAFSLTAENRTGPFDILPKHHNFMSLLSPCEMVIRTTDKGDQRIKISGGLLHVKANQVIVFLDV